MNNLVQFDTKTYTTLEQNINSFTINNPYINLVGNTVSSIVNLIDTSVIKSIDPTITTNATATPHIIKSIAFVLNNEDQLIFNASALQTSLEKYYGIIPVNIADSSSVHYIYKPDDYAPIS